MSLEFWSLLRYEIPQEGREKSELAPGEVNT